MASGQVLFQRFYYSKSFVKHNMEVSWKAFNIRLNYNVITGEWSVQCSHQRVFMIIVLDCRVWLSYVNIVNTCRSLGFGEMAKEILTNIYLGAQVRIFSKSTKARWRLHFCFDRHFSLNKWVITKFFIDAFYWVIIQIVYTIDYYSLWCVLNFNMPTMLIFRFNIFFSQEFVYGVYIIGPAFTSILNILCKYVVLSCRWWQWPA